MSGDRSWRKYGFYFLTRGTVRIWFKLRLHFRSYGSEYVPSEGGCIIAANHVSFLDPPAISIGLKHRVVRFLARDTLFASRIGGWFMRHVHCIPIDRTRGDIGALRKALAELKKGHVLCLFPEGTRSPDGELKEAKGGIGFLISKAGVPVVPAYVAGTYDVLPKGAKHVNKGKVSITYGKPINPSELSDLDSSRESYEEIGRRVMSAIAGLKEKSLADSKKQ